MKTCQDCDAAFVGRLQDGKLTIVHRDDRGSWVHLLFDSDLIIELGPMPSPWAIWHRNKDQKWLIEWCNCAGPMVTIDPLEN